ncbi:MAG: class I SAM-dependent methyltransferase [Oscillospiraceae bacterium]
MEHEAIIAANKDYWNGHADLWFGTTALPQYGVKFVTEEELHFFREVAGKRVLEICCGSGHSLKYLADRGAGELWGVDLSQKQLENARAYLAQNKITAKLICSPMEAELEVPKGYFDYVYSIYGIGWTTDLEGTFQKIASYLKQGGCFIFSWHHTLNYCVAWDCSKRQEVIEDQKLVFHRSYFDESYFQMPVHDSQIILCNRKISTYVNALAKAGFVLEQMVEQNEDAVLQSDDSDEKNRKARMVPLSVCFKARKL